MNEANRTAIVLLAAAWIVLMVVIIFLAWAAPGDTIEAFGDLVQEMENNNDTVGRLVVTLGALAVAVFGLLVIILELAPEDEERELRVKQAGSTTIVPAQALRQRVEEAIGSMPEVTTVKAKVWTQDNAIATNLDLGLIPRANVANVTQEASRLVVDIVQTELGLPVAGLPEVRISFGGEKPLPVTAAAASGTVDASPMFRRPPEASSTFQRPQTAPPVDPREMLGGAEDAPPSEPPVVDATEGTADSSPGPQVYDAESPRQEGGTPPSQDRWRPPPLPPDYSREASEPEQQQSPPEEPPSPQDAADPTPETPSPPPSSGGETRESSEDERSEPRP
jgi:hypothetical protein